MSPAAELARWTPTNPKFPLGQLVMTNAAMHAYGLSPDGVKILAGLLNRHASGDWGNMDAEDWKQNQWALGHGARLFSSYRVNPADDNAVVWIITEADRSYTTILFPEDY